MEGVTGNSGQQMALPSTSIKWGGAALGFSSKITSLVSKRYGDRERNIFQRLTRKTRDSGTEREIAVSLNG